MRKLDEICLVSRMTAALRAMPDTLLYSHSNRHVAYVASDAWGEIVLLRQDEYSALDQKAFNAELSRRAIMIPTITRPAA